MRLLLLLLIIGAVVLYLTNPTTAEIQAQLGGQLPPQLTGAPSMPTPPLDPTDVQPPVAPPVAPGDPPPMPDVPAAAIPDSAMQLDRKDYYLFSIYKVTVGGQTLPGCIIGIAKQAIPYDKCPE
jgi:hypothetical protein